MDLDFLEKKPEIRTSRVGVLVAFGDISGFRDWTKLPSVSPERFTEFMVKVYEKFINFRNGSGYFTKLMGDGLMAVHELIQNPVEDRKNTLRLLKTADALSLSIGRLIKNLRYPQPGGFRVRVVAGDVLKIEALRNGDQITRRLDYIGYTVNLASSLLDIERDTRCICHESVREIITRKTKRSGLKFLPMKQPAYCPKGIAKEDLSALWKFGA